MLLRILSVAIILAGGLYGYRVWNVQHAMDSLYDVPDSQGEGPKDAHAVIVEILDYRCSACRDTFPLVQEIVKRHPDVKIIYRHLPIFGPPSISEARMALAAARQGKFLSMHRRLMTRTEPVATEEMKTIAQEEGLDYNRMMKDMDSPEVAANMIKVVKAAEVLGIGVTPTFIAGGVIFAATAESLPSLDDLEQVVRQAQKEKR